MVDFGTLDSWRWPCCCTVEAQNVYIPFCYPFCWGTCDNHIDEFVFFLGGDQGKGWGTGTVCAQDLGEFLALFWSSFGSPGPGSVPQILTPPSCMRVLKLWYLHILDGIPISNSLQFSLLLLQPVAIWFCPGSTHNCVSSLIHIHILNVYKYTREFIETMRGMWMWLKNCPWHIASICPGIAAIALAGSIHMHRHLGESIQYGETHGFIIK